MYYYKNINTVQIAKQTGVSSQSVCAVMSRARKRLFRILQYYI